jgi:hypothetical protein
MLYDILNWGWEYWGFGWEGGRRWDFGRGDEGFWGLMRFMNGWVGVWSYEDIIVEKGVIEELY